MRVTTESFLRTDSSPVHRVSGPAELVQAIPYLLGFHPQDSLVLVGLAASRLVVTARVDLCDAEQTAPETVAAMRRGGAREVVLALYDDAADPRGLSSPLPWGELAWQVVDAVEAAGCEVVDVLLVGAQRWWSYLCGVPECCPPEGAPLPTAPSAFATAATVSGVVALPDRAALAAQLDPLPVADGLVAAVQAVERDAVGAVVRGSGERWERAAKRALFAAARRSDEPRWAGVGESELARFGAALRGQDVRDALWRAVDAKRLDGRPLWRELARRLPPPYDAVPAFLFGWRCWRAGEGALARVAAERSQASEPGFSGTAVLLAALSAGISPKRVPRLPRPG